MRWEQLDANDMGTVGDQYIDNTEQHNRLVSELLASVGTEIV